MAGVVAMDGRWAMDGCARHGEKCRHHQTSSGNWGMMSTLAGAFEMFTVDGTSTSALMRECESYESGLLGEIPG